MFPTRSSCSPASASTEMPATAEVPGGAEMSDDALMCRAIANAAEVRGSTAPNPWVGSVVVSATGGVYDGATQPVGGPHAERRAMTAAEAAGDSTEGATIYTTLEPCNFVGRTGACSEALIAAGVARVVVGIVDPEPKVAGSGIERLRSAGIDVTVGVESVAVTQQLRPYLHQCTTGRPWVVLKMAMTLDGRTAAPDGTSQWITSEAARVDVHRLRARCDSILVGAGTVRADDPALTVRHLAGLDPQRIVLGSAAANAKVHPCWEVDGLLEDVLDELGGRGVVDLLVEGGADVAAQFHRSGLVDEYILYVAPAMFGGDDGRPVFAGPGSGTMSDLWRGTIDDVERIGDDLRITVLAKPVLAKPVLA
ncbi:MAG: diaminohydroxyphosphoribosylaminopyrimidine deaminase [Candidatus Poriferisodalaceae bacterium]